MKVTDFAVLVTQHEGMKKEVNIAQIKEVLKVVDDLLKGDEHGGLYKQIRAYKATV